MRRTTIIMLMRCVARSPPRLQASRATAWFVPSGRTSPSCLAAVAYPLHRQASCPHLGMLLPSRTKSCVVLRVPGATAAGTPAGACAIGGHQRGPWHTAPPAVQAGGRLQVRCVQLINGRRASPRPDGVACASASDACWWAVCMRARADASPCACTAAWISSHRGATLVLSFAGSADQSAGASGMPLRKLLSR